MLTEDFGRPPQWRYVTATDFAGPHGWVLGAICALRQRSSGRTIATGWLIGPDMIATCAHGVIDSGGVDALFPGAPVPVSITNAYPLGNDGWDRRDASPRDILILFTSAPVGRTALRVNGTGGRREVTLVGHPHAEGFEMVLGQGIAEPTSAHLPHSCDSDDGHSGGPVIALLPGGDAEVLGLHVGGYGDSRAWIGASGVNLALSLAFGTYARNVIEAARQFP